MESDSVITVMQGEILTLVVDSGESRNNLKAVS